MSLKPIITVPLYWIDRSMAWGAAFVRHRAEHPEAAPRSHAVAGDGIEKDPYRQGCSKLCETAASIAFDRHPAQVNWSMIPDDGCDIYYKPPGQVDGLRIDVKGSKWDSHCLIWPVYKNAIFEDIKSDVLLFAQCEPPKVRLNGWVSKSHFGNNHRIAGEHHFLKPGTWYMEEVDLWDLKDLLPNAPSLRWAQSISNWPSASSASPSIDKTSAKPSDDRPSSAT